MQQQRNSHLNWLPGAAISAIGVIIGLLAFAAFCFALGLNFHDEGWSQGGDAWQTNRTTLIGSVIGLAVSILLFWIGFVQLTRSQRNQT